MSRGVQKIIGSSLPIIGKSYVYSVASMYGGDDNVRNEDVKWVLFKKDAGGWRKLNGPVKTGRSVTYSFGQIAAGNTFLLEAYVYNPEKKTPPGIIITPKAGPASIKKVEILDVNGGAIKGKLHFMDKVTLKVTTENMVGQMLKLSLWDEDTASDDLLWGRQSVQVTNQNGIVTRQVVLTAAMKTAGGASFFNEGYSQELYLYAEAAGIAAKTSTTKETMLAERSQPATVKGGRLDSSPVPGGNKPAVVAGQTGGGESCGEKYCIKIGEKSELVREVNIRLAGFGGNVPGDEFTVRTEKMIKQFQKDYMKVPETGKICGNVLRAIDDFGMKYSFTFNDLFCRCGECTGFGNGKFSEQKQDAKIAESGRKYEYPGIHRSMLWALRAVIFYTSVVEKDLKYAVRSISSGYRCHNDNRQHKRRSTNHMGKAIDLHFNKNGKRTQVVADIEEVREKIFNKYLGAKWDWTTRNIFNLESTRVGATTWVHYDVREFDVKYLEDKFFVKTQAAADGQKMMALAAVNHSKLCACNAGLGTVNAATRSTANTKNNFTVEDGKAALKIIYEKYGKDMAEIIEKLYRDETAHFASKQYAATGTGGMEAFGDAPYYGWDSSFFEANPAYKPMGLWSAFENAGLSKEGGNAQVTDRKKQFVILPSVLAGMEYKVFYTNKHGGNWARWHSTNETTQETYREHISEIRPRFTKEFEGEKNKK